MVYCSANVIVDMCRSADQVRGRGCKSDKVQTRFSMLSLSCWEEREWVCSVAGSIKNESEGKGCGLRQTLWTEGSIHIWAGEANTKVIRDEAVRDIIVEQ